MSAKCYSFKLEQSKSHKRSDGSYPVMLVVRKEDKRKTIRFDLSSLPDQWDKDTQRYKMDKRRKVLHPDREINNDWLNKKADDCDKILKDFEEKRIDWTLNQFEQAFLNRLSKTGVESYFNKHIESLRMSGHIGNMRCYEQCLHILKEHDSKFSLRVFPEIDKKYIEEFHKYLYKERRCKINTIRYYMKAFRALINKAIKDGEASETTYPFGKNGYQIKGEETDKRYLPSEYIEKLKTKTISDYHLNLYRNIFLFSYYCQGMAFVDMASLSKVNIVKMEKGDYLVYRRQKTEGKNGKAISIKNSDQIHTHLHWFKKHTPLIGDYLLPIVTVDGLDGEKLYQHIRDRLHRYNYNLKSVATAVGLDGVTLTGYVARHTYAMRLKNSNIPEDVISQALGHKDLNTTMTYLDSFENAVIDKANEVL